MEYSNLNTQQFAESIGAKTKQSLYDIANGKTKSISRTMTSKIIAYLPEINEAWLLTGEGDMLKNHSNARMVGSVYAAGDKDEGVLMVNYIPISATATFLESLSDGTNAEFEKYPLVPCGNESSESDLLRIFEVEGDSMYPTIPSGALILVKEIPEKSWHYAEGVVVAVYDTFVVVKRIVKNDLLLNNTLILGSDNKDYGQMVVQQSDLRALYKAKRIISSTIR